MKSVQAVWQGVVIAASNKTVQVEGNYYFPKSSINFDFLKPSETVTHCPWKGDAAYHHVELDKDNMLEDAVWSYPSPTREALLLKDHFAFWKGIEIVKESVDEKNSRLAKKINVFKEKLAKVSSPDADKENAINIEALRTLLNDLGEDGLIYTLPLEFTQNMSFFNFYNSNDACLQTDENHRILRVNRTFTWVFNHLPNMVGQSFEDFIKHVEIIEGEDYEKFFKKIKTHGWARIPKLRVRKEDESQYYVLDVAITKHGDINALTGFQCQLTNITKEVELSRSLEESQGQMKSLLSGIKEGLFFFERNGDISPERSLALGEILKGSENCANIYELVSKFSQVKRESVEVCLKLLWPPKENENFFSPFEMTISMLPKEVSIVDGSKTRYVKFLYNPLYSSSGQLEKVIVVVSDISEVIKNQKAAELQAERVEKISYAANNIESYKGFLDEANLLVSLTSENFSAKVLDPHSFAELQRHLHTLKGMLGIFFFNQLASGIHAIEDILSTEKEGSVSHGQEKWKNWVDAWKSETKDIDLSLGLDKNKDFFSVKKRKVDYISSYAKNQNLPELIELCDSLSRFEIAQVFDKYSSYLKELSSRRPEKKASIKFAESSCEIAYNEIKKVDTAIIHILRNCLDHGIEETEERVAIAKPEEGMIEFACTRKHDSITLTIADDGKGIDGDKLAEKALESGFWTNEELKEASWEDKINLIFAPNLSSKDEVTELSGRGVGMDAVKETMLAMGGEISISSKPGKGSSFILIIPVKG